MDLRSIYIANGIGVFILLLLHYVARAKTVRRSLSDRLSALMVFGVMLGCIVEVLSYTIDGQVFPGARLINYAANTYLYTANILLPLCVLIYVDYGLYGDLSRITKKYKPQLIAVAVMLAVNVANFFAPVSFYISAQNVYERRPVSYVYYFVILFICFTGMVTSHRYEKENGARRFISINMKELDDRMYKMKAEHHTAD